LEIEGANLTERYRVRDNPGKRRKQTEREKKRRYLNRGGRGKENIAEKG